MFFVNSRIVFLLPILMFSVLPVFAQSEDVPFLTVLTDDNHYDEGDTIVVSGQAATVIVDTPIILQVWHEGNMVDIAQFFPAQDGSYSHTIIAEKPSWKQEGEYLIRVSYSEGNIAETSIDFTPRQESLETTDSFEVEIPNGGTFDAEYTILGGTVQDMILEPENFTLRVLIEAPDEGTISIKLPKEAIDAKKSNDQNEEFIILIGEIQYPYKETETSDESRLITINFEEGDSEIRIIGTYAIPEFGSITALILIFGIISTIIFTKNKYQLKFN